ncbi:alpha/beta hydrolase [Streptomyces sp. NPDC048639]|uniref:alpha/beta hydrolase n=1 Tax=Streptomyces sp. NPDC048639 TaxID=3365581 RepID=UPI00371AEC63
MSPEPEADFARSRVPSITSGIRHGHLRTTLLTEDGVRIEAAYEPWAGAPGSADEAHEADHAGSAGGEDRPDSAGGAGSAGGPDSADGPDFTGGQGAGAPPSAGLAIVVAHGFTGSLHRPALQRAARTFGRHAAVITFSFRGHGRSGGRSTVGDREVLDLAAAVRWARSLGHTRVATVGFSMGGSVVIRHAALHRRPAEDAADATDRPPAADAADAADPEDRADRADRADAADAAGRPGRDRNTDARSLPGTHTDAVVAISAPARWYYRGTAPMRRLHWVVQRPVGRLVGRFGLRTRIHTKDWNPVPLSPVEAVPLIPPVPLLIVHGDRDPYFPLDHPHSLAAAAPQGAAELWIEEGLGHAENAAEAVLLHRVADWLVAAG